MIADIFITTYNRPLLFESSLKSLLKNTNRNDYRLTVVYDGCSKNNTSTTWYENAHGDYLDIFLDYGLDIDHIIHHKNNLGLGPSINQALAYIDSLKKWDGDNAPPFTLYLQDDIRYSQDWLRKLSKMFLMFETQHNLGFASGIECIEHKVKKDIGGGLVLKDWIRATCMFARHDYWMSMYPISRLDPETGRERARPHDGIGSGVDWWFIRNHPNSVCKSGKTNLVIPGLLQHKGYNKSTWLDRELPESDEDKKKLKIY